MQPKSDPPKDSTGRYFIMDEDAVGDVPGRIVAIVIAALLSLVILAIALLKGCMSDAS